MMELKWKDPLNNIIKKILKKKHTSIFICLLFLIIIINSYVILAIGPNNFFDSFKNPSSYYSDFVKIESNNGLINNKKCIIQKISHPNFSFSDEDHLCLINSYGSYKAISLTSINKSFNFESKKDIDILENQLSKNQEKIIGKIIAYQNNNLFEELSFSYWLICKEFLNVEFFLNQNNVGHEVKN